MKRGKHKSLEAKVKLAAAWIESLPEVSAVIVGRSESCRHKFAPGTVLVKAEVPAGLKLCGYGGFGVTAIYVYCPAEKIKDVRAAIEARYP